jgi:hypothetical protein
LSSSSKLLTPLQANADERKAERGSLDREENVHFDVAVVFKPGDGGLVRGLRNGRPISRFDPMVSEYNQSGELFRIDGHCQSACTLFLAIRNVCIESDAELLFHAVTTGIAM